VALHQATEVVRSHHLFNDVGAETFRQEWRLRGRPRCAE
jgi:hypothetical protein